MKEKFKKMLPYILIVGGVLLLIIVSIVVMQFYSLGERLGYSKMHHDYSFVNESSYSKADIEDLITSKRDDLIRVFNHINYYRLSDIDSVYTSSDDDIYMVLTDDFITKLGSYVTPSLLSYLTRDFEAMETDYDGNFYKVLRSEFDYLHLESALAIFNYMDMEIYPLHATSDEISSMINFRICEDDFCKRDDVYEFVLEKVNDDWLVSSIGVK